jgi:hypothetical protein
MKFSPHEAELKTAGLIGTGHNRWSHDIMQQQR